MIPSPIDPTTGLCAEFSFADYVALWRGCRDALRRRKARRLSRRVRKLSDAELSEMGLVRSSPWR